MEEEEGELEDGTLAKGLGLQCYYIIIMLRRTERATAREREREQEQRGRVPSSAPTVVALPRNHTFY